MENSNLQPDLDWSQVKETITLLTVSVAMVQNSMQQGDTSVTSLADTFTAMVEDMQAIEGVINTIEEGEAKQQALAHCQNMQSRIQTSIIAFQFYDRLQQSLEHVVLNLDGLSNLIADPQRLYNPYEWHKFKQEIRQRYTMEQERIMFDAILAGKSLEEAIELVNEAEKTDDDNIELF
jgi:hypothetical protein